MKFCWIAVKFSIQIFALISLSGCSLLLFRGVGSGGGTSKTAVVANKEATNSEDSITLTYNYTENGCSTGDQTFLSKAELCSGLEDNARNKNCAISLRKENFCGSRYACGEFFQGGSCKGNEMAPKPPVAVTPKENPAAPQPPPKPQVNTPQNNPAPAQNPPPQIAGEPDVVKEFKSQGIRLLYTKTEQITYNFTEADVQSMFSLVAVNKAEFFKRSGSIAVIIPSSRSSHSSIKKSLRLDVQMTSARLVEYLSLLDAKFSWEKSIGISSDLGVDHTGFKNTGAMPEFDFTKMKSKLNLISKLTQELSYLSSQSSVKTLIVSDNEAVTNKVLFDQSTKKLDLGLNTLSNGTAKEMISGLVKRSEIENQLGLPIKIDYAQSELTADWSVLISRLDETKTLIQQKKNKITNIVLGDETAFFNGTLTIGYEGTTADLKNTIQKIN